MDPNLIFAYLTSAVAIFVLGDCLIKLYTERHRLIKEELNNDDLIYATKLAFFIALPLVAFIDLRTTEIFASYLGAQVTGVTYGFIWFNADLSDIFASIKEPYLLPVLFAGSLTQIALALVLLPTLLFRPHPLLSAVVAYLAVFLLGYNLLADPFLGLIGQGVPRFAYLAHRLMHSPDAISIYIASFYAISALIYVATLKSNRVRLWFSGLTKPALAQKLKIILKDARAQADGANHDLRLINMGLLYLRAGMNSRVRGILKEMKTDPDLALEYGLLDGLMAFNKQRYSKARKCFDAAQALAVGTALKSRLLAAAACSAYAAGDTKAAFELADRSIEFDDTCIVARMVKVDVYLSRQNKEACAQEIMVAMHMGLELDLKDKVPISIDEALALIDQDRQASLSPEPAEIREKILR